MNNQGKDWIEKIPNSKFLPQHIISLGVGTDGKRYYIGKDGIKKTEDELTNAELMDLQIYQPRMEDSGRI